MKGEQFEFLNIYNLMKLKKNLIEIYMEKNALMMSSPSEILYLARDKEQYFF